MVYRDSVPVEGVLQLQGVWIMDPDQGGQASARGYPYGSAQREEALDAMGEASFYAGRTDPVMDFGEHESYSFSVTVDLPHGPAWRESVEDFRAWGVAKKVLHIRDNRGRSIHGTLGGMRLRDLNWGTQASFTVTKADRPLEVVIE